MYIVPNFADGGGSSGGAGGGIPGATPSNAVAGTSSNQNQWMGFPGMTAMSVPGYGGGGAQSNVFGSLPTTNPGYPSYGGSPGYGVPPSAGLPSSYGGYPNYPQGPWPTAPAKSAGTGLQGGAATVPTQDPYFTQLFQQMLTGQLGQGTMPYNLSTYLPTSGQMTQPGQLSAPLTSSMQSLQDFFAGQSQGVSGVPGTSGPLSYVLPMWQSEVSAMNQPIQQNLANLKEQFGQMGALGSSELANASQNYLSQTALNEQSLLGQLTMQALPQQQQFASGMQGLDQQAIQNMYQEFIRTQPQYNPLMQAEEQLALAYPPVYGKQGFGASFAGGLGQSLGGGLGAGLSGLLFG